MLGTPLSISTWLDSAPACPGGNVMPDRWQMFLADARKFVADGWLERAEKFEWLPTELWSVDPKWPFAPTAGRIGLVPAIAGRTVVGANRDWFVLRNVENDDCRIHFRELAIAPSRQQRLARMVPIWEIAPARAKIIEAA